MQFSYYSRGVSIDKQILQKEIGFCLRKKFCSRYKTFGTGNIILCLNKALYSLIRIPRVNLKKEIWKLIL